MQHNVEVSADFDDKTYLDFFFWSKENFTNENLLIFN